MNILENVLVKGCGNIANHILMVATSDGSFLIDERQIPTAWKTLTEKGPDTFVNFEWDVGHRGDDFIRKFLPRTDVQARAEVICAERRANAEDELAKLGAR